MTPLTNPPASSSATIRRPGRRSVAASLWTAVAWAVLATGCGGGAAAGEPTVIRVFAAASLTDAFTDLEQRFESASTGAQVDVEGGAQAGADVDVGVGVDVELNLAGSSSLRAQILSGAPADVFAAANLAVMDEVVAAGATAGPPRAFASNRLEIAVPRGNPAGIGGLADFARSELFIGLCAESVPCGDLADQALAAAGVTPSIDTREPDVRALLNKVAVGELDAGIVYTTDVLAMADEIDGIEIAPGLVEPAQYPIAVLAEGPNPDGGAAFVDFVLSPEGQAILAEHGFGQP